MAMLNIADPQDATGCCHAIQKVIRKGELDAVEVWQCPKCGINWEYQIVESVRFWTARPVVMVWK